MAALSKDSPVGIVGAGTMGSGIAQVAAAAGHPVLLFDAAAGAAQRGRDGIAKALARLVDKERMTDEARDALLSRVSVIDDLGQLAPARLVVEAIVEDIGIKRDVFRRLEDICGDEAILATNTSSLSVTAVGAGLNRPERLVGMHFFNPAPVMKLVEVISGLATDRGIAETVHATAAAWGKAPVHATSTPGFIVNRVARPFYAEALRVLQEGGASVATVDAVMREAGGFRMGPFELMDLIGNDVNYAVTSSVWNAYYNDPRYAPSLAQKELVDAGRLGRKSGIGWYPYGEDAATPQPATADPAPPPGRVLVDGDLGPAEALAGVIEKAGIPVQRIAGSDGGDGALVLDDAVVRLTDGRSATERAARGDDEPDKVILFDLALDYAAAGRIALAPAAQASPAALAAATGLFQALGMKVSVIADIPGMIVARTVAMLANEGSEALYQGVTDAAGVDTAMMQGVNYPRGPLAWADAIGPARVAALLDNLASSYGEDRYRLSPLLRRKVLAGGSFHE